MIIEFDFTDDDDFGIEDIQELSDLNNKQVRFAIATSVIEAIENGYNEAPFMRILPADMLMSVKPSDYKNALDEHASVLVELEEFEWAQRAQKAQVVLSNGWPILPQDD